MEGYCSKGISIEADTVESIAQKFRRLVAAIPHDVMRGVINDLADAVRCRDNLIEEIDETTL